MLARKGGAALWIPFSSRQLADGDMEDVTGSLWESFGLRSCCTRYSGVGKVLSSRIGVRLIGRSAIGDSV